MPAFWVCITMIALAFAPLTARITGRGHYHIRDGVQVVLSHWALQPTALVTGDILATNPHPNSWDGSLWTLGWEALCYGCVLILGVTGLLRRRWVIPSGFVFWWCVSLAGLIYPPRSEFMLQAPRLFVMFFAGALIYQWRDRIPLSWPLIAECVLIVVVSAWLPDYRLAGALPLAYVCLGVGALCSRPALRTDLSYGIYIYSFAVQQVMAATVLVGLSIPVFFMLSMALTLPLAAASWFVVERPSLRLKAVVDRSIADLRAYRAKANQPSPTPRTAP